MKLSDILDTSSVNIVDVEKNLSEFKKIVINEGIYHPEDLIFDYGSVGAKKAIQDLVAIQHNSESISIKWDGGVGIVFGRNSDGKLIIADKHMFSKFDKNTGNRPGLTTTSDEFKHYDLNREADRSNLWDQERTIRPGLEKMIPDNQHTRNNFYFGDLLWSGKLTPIDGYYVITPNTVTYKIKYDSDIGKRISASIGGIAVHSFIPGIGEADRPIIDVDEFLKTGPVVILSGEMTEKATVNLDSKILKKSENLVAKYGQVADDFIKELSSLKAKMVLSAMKTYITSKISSGNFENLVDDFLIYLPTKLSSQASREKLLGNSNGWLYKNGYKGLEAVWILWKSVSDLKIAIKNQIDSIQNDPNLPIRAYINDDIGHEGYVIGSGHDKLKLVDRLSFSKANFSKPRRNIKENKDMPLASFCFGRMNPPTLGHKRLIDKTIEIGGNNSFIFLSKSHDSKNPLDYETKVEFIKKMFPESADKIVGEQAINPIYAITWLYDKGFRNITFVAGQDRLGDKKGTIETVLKRWNSDKVRQSDTARGPDGREEVTLNFISAGDRDLMSNDLEGFSGSKAREAAKNKNKKLFYKITGANQNIKVNGNNLYDYVLAGVNYR